MSFLPPSMSLRDQLESASEEATEETWNFVRAGLLIRLDIPAVTEMNLRRCRTCEDFRSTSAQLAKDFPENR